MLSVEYYGIYMIELEKKCGMKVTFQSIFFASWEEKRTFVVLKHWKEHGT